MHSKNANRRILQNKFDCLLPHYRLEKNPPNKKLRVYSAVIATATTAVGC